MILTYFIQICGLFKKLTTSSSVSLPPPTEDTTRSITSYGERVGFGSTWVGPAAAEKFGKAGTNPDPSLHVCDQFLQP